MLYVFGNVKKPILGRVKCNVAKCNASRPTLSALPSMAESMGSRVFSLLSDENLSLSTLLVDIFLAPDADSGPFHIAKSDLTQNLERILHAMGANNTSRSIIMHWAIEELVREMDKLHKKAESRRFKATKLEEEDIRSLELNEMCTMMEGTAPNIWCLIGRLMGRDSILDKRKKLKETKLRSDGMSDELAGGVGSEDPSEATDLTSTQLKLQEMVRFLTLVSIVVFSKQCDKEICRLSQHYAADRKSAAQRSSNTYWNISPFMQRSTHHCGFVIAYWTVDRIKYH